MGLLKYIFALVIFLFGLSLEEVSASTSDLYSYQKNYNYSAEKFSKIKEIERAGLSLIEQVGNQNQESFFQLQRTIVNQDFLDSFLLKSDKVKRKNCSTDLQILSSNRRGFRGKCKMPEWLFNKNPELVDAWKALGEFPNLRKIPGNLEVLHKVKVKFTYGGKTGQEALEEIFTGHQSAQKFIDNLNKAEELFDGVGVKHWSGIKSSGEVRLVNNAGVVVGKIDNGVFTVTASKGSIPDPSTYLDETYITNHINKFKQDGAGFIVVKSWTEGGNPLYTTLPSRKFVGLRSEMDEVITKYKAQGNDWTVLRDELNLGASTDLTNEEIFYIKINGDDARFSYELPNGNEGYPNPSGGAIVGEWKPGGYTKNGTAEAALIGSEYIAHNKDIDQLLNNFSGMWEKIK